MKPLKIILSGGGTGGHIFPAVAIANQIKKIVPHADILFVGAVGKMEMEKVPAAGYKIIGLNIVGFKRKICLSNFIFPFKLIVSLIKAKKIIKNFKPDVVVGTGGFASGPTLRAACNNKIPTLIQEQNSYAGITNKILSNKVNKICVAYHGMEKFFPKEKIILTGNPIRQDIQNFKAKREEALKFFELDSRKKTLLIIGGSLGAKTINETIGLGLKKIADSGIQVLWQTGKNYYEKAKQQCKPYNNIGIFSFDFITKMDLAYSVADCVVSRAGASSVSELCCVKIPSILVPSPNVAEDHQTKNAMALVNKNAAILIKDVNAQNELIDETIKLFTDIKKQEELKNNISQFAFLDSAEVIAKEVIKLANY